MIFCAKCGTGTYYRAAMTVAIIDIIYTATILVLFVLGTSLMVGFEFQGGPSGGKNTTTRVVDEVTDEVFGTKDTQIDNLSSKDIAEDMGVFLIIMFLSVVDFIISCIFLDGVKTKNAFKCQTWFNLRLVILVIFDIVVFINVMYGSSWFRCIPDAILTVYRLLGIMIGYAYLQELQANYLPCQNCRCSGGSVYSNTSHRTSSIINLSARRKEIQEALKNMPPNIIVSGPDETITFASTSRKSSDNTSPRITLTRKSADNTNAGTGAETGEQKDNSNVTTAITPETVKDKA